MEERKYETAIYQFLSPIATFSTTTTTTASSMTTLHSMWCSFPRGNQHHTFQKGIQKVSLTLEILDHSFYWEKCKDTRGKHEKQGERKKRTRLLEPLIVFSALLQECIRIGSWIFQVPESEGQSNSKELWRDNQSFNHSLANNPHEH